MVVEVRRGGKQGWRREGRWRKGWKVEEEGEEGGGGRGGRGGKQGRKKGRREGQRTRSVVRSRISRYALLQQLEFEEVGEDEESVQQAILDPKLFSKMVKLKAFHAFATAEEVLIAFHFL